ncbi:phosphoinositide 3-kinase adapter protein 1-like isoform x5, partial [Plakobranchus ocellatus]
MSGHLNDVILFLHAPDGSRWSNFMSTRLESPPYEIKSIAKDVTILEGPPDDDDDDDGGDHDGYGIEANMGSRESEERDESAGELYLNTSEILPYTSKTKKSDGNNNSANTAVTSGSNEEIPAMSAEEECEREIPTTIERKDRAGKTSSCESTSSAVILTANSSLEECILYSRACIVFLSPDILTSESPFPIEISVLNPRSTVFLLLGVEIQEVRRFFDSQSDLVFKCRCCHIDGSQVSICDALLQIVQAYEDTGGSSSVSGSDTQEFDPEDVGGGGIYNTPSSVQLNHVEKIFPRELTGGDRVVYALLEQSPEYKVFVEIASSNKEFEMTQVCDRLYSFSVPEGLNGKVSFVIGSQGHEIGRESVRVLSRLDQLHEILSEETDPKSMVAQAIGVVSGDEAGLDTALALRLQQLASAKTFATLFPVEEDLQKKKSR